MALLVGGQVEPRERAYAGAAATQRADGSWPMKIVAGEVEDASGETNMSRYLAVGVWHHWLVTRDGAFVDADVAGRAPRRWTGWSALQLPFGGIAWSQEWPTGPDGQRGGAAGRLVEHLPRSAAGWRSPSCSTSRSPSGSWPAAGSATRCASTATCSWTSRRSRWTGTTRCSAAPSAATPAAALLDERWDDFVVPGLGIRCVDTNPWVTGAETCELVLALDALGDRDRALELFADMQHLRDEDGRYWTGYVYPDGNWPVEHTTYTAPR